MATAKTARTKGSATKEKDNNPPKLEESLFHFKSDKFDADAYVRSKCSLNEKDIKQLCCSLLEMKKASAEELRKSVYANYSAFIRTSKEISDLEGELSSIRNFLSTQAALIHGLADGVHIDASSIIAPDNHTENGFSSFDETELSDLEKWASEFPDLLDVLLAERKIDEALDTLDEGDRIVAESKQTKYLSASVLSVLHNAITERRQKLADQLAESANQPSTRGSELRSAIAALKRLGDGP
ncbi:hypothetical protein MLD38_008034 [Melastoma candidum]|uniref:Uncharacterized protein n=1 Tax=Melastoma candidum TaxID=119954 RepID=A0ACB9RU96_9MYRT|nr:hypothetical protein MLD38_008034 [Melastoma candidum]